MSRATYANRTKLSASQRRVLEHLRDGWTLYRSLGHMPNVSSYNHAIGQSETVRFPTYFKLLENRLIEIVDEQAYPLLYHRLTSAGRRLLKE